MSGLIGVWAQHDPMAAATFAAQMQPGEMQNQSVMSALLGWANQNPVEAANWALQFPDNTMQEQGIKEIIGAWSSSDYGGALTWAKGLPEGITRDAALNDLIESAAYWSPDKAAEIVPLIGDQTKQEESMEIVMRFWSKTDPTSARNWLTRLNAPEALKSQLQSLLTAN
jgi:hypothetical protein